MATFIFSGDPKSKINPDTCELFGMTFPLNEKVDVEDLAVTERLRRHSHFTEIDEPEVVKPRRGRPPKVTEVTDV